MTRRIQLSYAILCQAGWFVCVIGAAKGLPWLGVAFAGVAVALHLWSAPRTVFEAKLLLVVLLGAALWESALSYNGVLLYKNGMLLPHTAPIWILALWALFAIQINVIYRWLRDHPLIAALVGAIGGPLSFRAGAALGAVVMPHPLSALAVLGVGWAIGLPLITTLAKRWDGIGAQQPVAEAISGPA